MRARPKHRRGRRIEYKVVFKERPLLGRLDLRPLELLRFKQKQLLGSVLTT